MAAPAFSILCCFACLKDPRLNRRKRHLLLDLITVALCAVIAGADNWQQIEAFGRKRLDWLKTFLSLPNGIASHDTFERLFQKLSPSAFQRCLLQWLHGWARQLGARHFAIDGKTLRGSARPGQDLGPLQLVSVWAAEVNLSLGQVAVEEGSNEITAIPKLLELLDLKGALVTIDAIGCQTEIASRIVEGGGDYLLVVKANQEHLQDDILATLERAEAVDFQGIDYDVYQTEEEGHGRREYRQYLVFYGLEHIRDRERWAKLTVVGLCYRESAQGDKTSEEVRCFIGSKKAKARYYGRGLRNHWRIENNLHWQLDVTFGEDANRVQQRNAAENLALLRRLALSLLKRHAGKGSVATKRYEATLDSQMLEEILKG
jgi:predicted transposase YbfD/YdcC